jgi:hypothetical protein
MARCTCSAIEVVSAVGTFQMGNHDRDLRFQIGRSAQKVQVATRFESRAVAARVHLAAEHERERSRGIYGECGSFATAGPENSFEASSYRADSPTLINVRKCAYGPASPDEAENALQALRQI